MQALRARIGIALATTRYCGNISFIETSVSANLSDWNQVRLKVFIRVSDFRNHDTYDLYLLRRSDILVRRVQEIDLSCAFGRNGSTQIAYRSRPPRYLLSRRTVLRYVFSWRICTCKTRISASFPSIFLISIIILELYRTTSWICSPTILFLFLTVSLLLAIPVIQILPPLREVWLSEGCVLFKDD